MIAPAFFDLDTLVKATRGSSPGIRAGWPEK
jgi:hypothetical protein